MASSGRQRPSTETEARLPRSSSSLLDDCLYHSEVCSDAILFCLFLAAAKKEAVHSSRMSTTVLFRFTRLDHPGDARPSFCATHCGTLTRAFQGDVGLGLKNVGICSAVSYAGTAVGQRSTIRAGAKGLAHSDALAKVAADMILLGSMFSALNEVSQSLQVSS